MTWRVVVVALLTVTAGCAALGGTATRTPPETVTPAPVPTIATTDHGPTLPPGVSGGGDIDVDRLAEAHLAVIANRSYVRSVSRRIGTRTSNVTLRVESPTRYRYERSDAPATTNSSGYANGSVLYTRYVEFGSKFSVVESERAQTRHGGSTTEVVRGYLNLSNATVAETLVDGRLHYAVTAERDRVESINAREFRVRAVIRPDGLVRSLNATYVVYEGGNRVPVSYAHRYDLRPVTVERPGWVDREFDVANVTAGRQSAAE